MNWWKAGIGIIGAIGVIGIGWAVSRPMPGIKMDDQGREHVTPQTVADFKYNSNPPTSGPHLPTWVKAGVYDRPQSEGELLHALEHGYVIINYNCNAHLKAFRQVFAHEEEGSSSADFVDPTIATGSAMNESDGCKTLVKQLTEVANQKKFWKLIVVPRPQLDTTIALTAWTYLDTFDQPALPAGRFDEKRIARFIDYHRDGGPEKTME